MTFETKWFGGMGLLLAGLIAVAPDSAVAQATMTDDELRAAFADKDFNISGKYSGSVWYRADGSVGYRLVGGAVGRGTWRVKDGKLCTRYARRRPPEKCYTMQKLGEGKYLSNDGTTAVLK